MPARETSNMTSSSNYEYHYRRSVTVEREVPIYIPPQSSTMFLPVPSPSRVVYVEVEKPTPPPKKRVVFVEVEQPPPPPPRERVVMVQVEKPALTWRVETPALTWPVHPSYSDVWGERDLCFYIVNFCDVDNASFYFVLLFVELLIFIFGKI